MKRRYSITVFPELTNSRVLHKYELTWEGLFKALTKTRPDTPKKRQVLWSPALFSARRSAQDTMHISCIVLDIDDGTDFNAVTSKLNDMDVMHIAHTSYSHTDALHKFRLVLPIHAEPLEICWTYPEIVWKHYHAAATEWFRHHFGGTPDQACKDISRAYFLGGYNPNQLVSFNPSGIVYDWVAMAEKSYEYAEQAKAMAKAKADQLRAQQEAHRKYCKGRYRSHSDDAAYMAALLKTCPTTRRTLAEKLNMRIRGNRAEGFTCPLCHLNDATYFYIDPQGQAPVAFCAHENKCTSPWFHLGDLAKINGVL